MLVLFCSPATSQPNYTFSQGAGSPTLLTPTYTEHTTGTTDYGVYTNISIGFTFYFNCSPYTVVSISNDGYIVMGSSLSNTYTPLSTGSDNNVIAVLAADLQGAAAGSSLRSKTSGSAPNRTFTVEWKNYKKYAGTGDYTFQVVLNETSNNIQCYYSTATADAATTSYEVGIRGNSSSDFMNRTKAANTSWTASSAGTLNTDVMTCGSTIARSPGGLHTWTYTNCSGTPAGGTAAASPTGICLGENSNLSVTGGAVGCGLTYQWQSGPAAGGPWTDISGATGATYSATPGTSTYYRRATTCTASGLTGYSSSVQVTINTCIIVGTGTSTTSSYPYRGLYDDARSQYIITASELSAAGLCPNSTLSSLSFNVSSKASTQAYSGFTIKIGHTTSSTFSSATWLTPAFTTCYNGNFTTGNGWNLHNFSTNFTWNGTDNIVVETCFNNTSFSSDDPVYYTTTASGNTVCYAEMDASTGCTLIAESTSSSRPNMKFNYSLGPPCSGTPTGGTASASPGSVCAGASSTVSLSGHTVACSITYQWQWSPNPVTVWTNITGATSTSITVTPAASTNYRCVVTCTASGNSANSSTALVTVTNAPAYASLPYSTSFESNWINRCSTRDAPDNSWVNIPATGDNSWRRNDDGAAASWTGPASGIYSPVSSAGSYSARFHSYNATSGSQGRLDLYINLNTAGTKSLCFDYINTSGSDVLAVLLSTDGGLTFPTTLLSLTTASSWTQQTTTISSTSSTCVIRFIATADYGASDIGIDNLSISLPSVPNCATYTSPSNGATNIICGVNSVLRWTSNGPSCFPPTSYDVYFGTAASPPFVTNTTSIQYDPGTLSTSTTYYWKIVPKNGNGAATGCATWSFTTGASFYPAQTTAPFTDDLENCQEWTIVNGTEANKWIWGSSTAYSGSKSMYVSDGAMNTYTITSTSTSHFYKDIIFPSGYDFTLQFYWKGVAESCCDELTVYLAPTSETPVAGTEMSSTYLISPAYNQSATWVLASIGLSGISCSGETRRLIFSWHNDGSGGTDPPAAVDYIMITATARTGQTCSNPYNVTLPFTKSGETTNCFGNDYSNSSTASCGSSYESGNDKVYKVLVGAAGCVNVTLTNANSSSIGFQVYNGCPDVGGTTCVFYTTSGASGGTLSADINIPSAGYYYFIVDNWAAPTYVNYDIAISAPGGNNPADPVCGATTLTLGVSASGDNTCTNASGEPAAPVCWTTGTMNTIWYVVTIPASRDLAIKTTAGSLLKTQIDVYRGNACGSLTYVDCNQDAASCGTSYDHSYLLLNNIGTGTYAYIRVDGEDNLVGTFSILVIDGNNGSPQWNNYPLVGQDCGPVTTNTNPVCGQTTTVDNPGYFAYGNICDFTGSGICLASGEKSVVWYTININANGNLEFDIVPNDYGNPNPITGQSNPNYTTAGSETDYDFAIWKWESTCDGTGDGAFCCTEIAAGTTAATRCDYSGLGVTGLYGTVDSDAPAAYDPEFDDAYVSRIAVSNGEAYVLAISNFANDYVSGFTMQFSGTSPIAYSTPGASLTWGSNTSNDWSLPGNWGGCTDPTCNLNAVINSGGAQPVISANASVQNLTISAGATLTINANCTLTVCGNFVNNGTLTMASTSTLLFNNGSVVQNITGALTGTNKIGNLVINKTGGSVIINPVVAIDIGGNFTTVNTNSIFNANNQTVKVAGNFSTAANTTITNFANIQFNGTIPQTYSNSSGTITWTNVIINNSGGGLTLSGGATSNLVVAGTLTLTNGIIYSANPPLLIMNAGSSVAGGGTSSFVDGPMQKIGNTAFVFPLGDAFNRWARLGISAPTAASTFEAQYFYSGYTNTNAMAGAPAPVLNNVSKIEYWQLNRAAGTGNATVTLYWENASASYINSCAGAPNTGDLVVARWNGTGWENKNTTGGSYSGSCAGTSAGTVTSDVVTAFSPFTFGSKSSAVNPLPVGLLTFTGENAGDINILRWETGTETNNDFFTMERSANGWDFSEIGIIEGAGTTTVFSSYHHTDHSPMNGINYYRLKQTDLNGYSTYAPNVVALKSGIAIHEDHFTVFPNPATDKIIVIPKSTTCHAAAVEITDISGRIVHKYIFTQPGNGVQGLLEISVAALPSGIYLLNIQSHDNSPLLHSRFVKTQP